MGSAWRSSGFMASTSCSPFRRRVSGCPAGGHSGEEVFRVDLLSSTSMASSFILSGFTRSKASTRLPFLSGRAACPGGFSNAGDEVVGVVPGGQVEAEVDAAFG